MELNHDGELRGQVAIVTGAASGIGRETAFELARRGAAIMAADLNGSGAESAAFAIEAAGGRALGVGVDVADRAQVGALVQRTEDDLGKIDILINNAGINRDKSALKMDAREWGEVIRVNLDSAFYCSTAVAERMRGQGRGRVVNTSSISARGNFGQANYAAAKAGLIGLTRTLAIEWARYGITVNAVAPGFIKTEMTDAMPEKSRDATVARIPIGRIGSVFDIARAHAFLASPDSGFITGQVLVVDGGRTLV